MATVVFDFDSTLIRCESLEEIVAPRFENQPDVRQAYEDMTRKGMEGSWSFRESLTNRLAVAAPNRAELEAFAGRVADLWTPGIPELVAWLHDQGHAAWVMSGGFREALIPAVAELGIPAERVLAVQLLWADGGEFAGVDPADPFSTSKVAGIKATNPEWDRPSVMVGDGITDRAVYDAGLTDQFVPFTAWVRRPGIVPDGIPEADSVEALQEILARYLSR